jgi:hypothetical protein
MVLSLVGLTRGATQNSLSRIDMEIDNKIDVKLKMDYLKLALKISKIRYKGEEPPQGLMHQAHEIGRLAGISEQELKNL